jgi:hypothetical protein
MSPQHFYFISFGYLPSHETAGSHMSSSSDSLKNLHADFQVTALIYIPTNSEHTHPHPHQHLLLFIF